MWRALPCLLLGLLALGSAAPAGAQTDQPTDTIPIADLLADPEPFHLKLVPLRGVVRNVRALEPYYQPSGAGCYGAYTFMLEDATGSLHVSVLGLCGTPILKNPDVADGDQVLVTAEIHAADIKGTARKSDGSPFPDLDPEGVYAVARIIARDQTVSQPAN
jgi:hypothetical protein